MNALNDNQVEILLRRYRPLGPPPSVRAKLRKSAGKTVSLRTMLVVSAIAAILVLNVGLNLAADALARDTARLLGSSASFWTPEAEQVAQLFDPADEGRAYLALLLKMERRNQTASPPPIPFTL